MLGRKNESQTHKVLDVDASFQGHLVFKDAVHLCINGRFEGRLETKGELIIGEHAVVKAEIFGEKITLAGNITGDLVAVSEIRLTPTARVVGNIQTPSLVMEKGCFFQGQCSMLSDTPTSARRAAEPAPHTRSTESAGPAGSSGGRKVLLGLEEVAHYLSVETSLISEWAESGKLPGQRGASGWQFDKEKVDDWIANGRIS